MHILSQQYTVKSKQGINPGTSRWHGSCSISDISIVLGLPTGSVHRLDNNKLS